MASGDILIIANKAEVQDALDLKATLESPTFTGTVSGITKAMVGLENASNYSSANMPISTATNTELGIINAILDGTTVKEI